MGYLEGWVSQLVMIVLFAVILELLLPAGGFQKYVKLVLGLVLIVALMDPVIKLFHMDPGQIIGGIPTQNGSSQLTLETNQQKKEIEQAQAAYIHEEVAVQMKNRVKEELNGRYGLEITNLVLSANQGNTQNVSLKSITVVAAKSKKNGGTGGNSLSAVRPVDEVSINIGDQVRQNKTGSTSAEADKIRSFLAEQWGVDEKIISLRIEGGD